MKSEPWPADLRAAAGRDTHHRLYYGRRGTPTQWSLAEALTRTAAMTWDGARIRAHAETFSLGRFLTEMQQVVDETLEAPVGSVW